MPSSSSASPSSSTFVPPPLFDLHILTSVVLYLIWLYSNSGRNADTGLPQYQPTENGGPSVGLTSVEQGRMPDVEEFELGGLLEEEEEDSEKRDSDSMETQPITRNRSSIDHQV